jgi:hypothetical protein
MENEQRSRWFKAGLQAQAKTDWKQIVLHQTYPQLTAETDWAALHHVPVGHNVISVKHTHAGMTTFSNESGPDIAWRASLPGKFDVLLIDGKKAPAESATRTGGMMESYQVLQVKAGETHVVSVG